MNYQFRPFNGTDEDYEAIVAIDNVLWPDDPDTIEQFKHNDSTQNPDRLFGRHLCVYDGQIVGSGSYNLVDWYPTPNQFRLGWGLLPEHEEAAAPPFIAYLKEQLAIHNPQGYLVYSQEDKPLRNQILEADGFKITQRSPRSELDVATFDGTAYETLHTKLEAEGIKFVTLTTFKERDRNWLVTYEAAAWEIVQDMPTSEPLMRRPLSEFEKQFSEPSHLSDGHIFAFKEGEIVGYSVVSVNVATNEKFYTNFTGVKRPYRRKGIATALKAQIVKFAQAYGATIIQTDNEENNPMYTLNMQLGFKPLPAELEYKKQL